MGSQDFKKRKEPKMKAKAFTLIELLIVVAIIAVLAAIAIPNFMEAQIRAKVSRTKSDIRTQAMALDSYCIDWNSYTKDSDSSLDTIGNPGLSFEDKANGVLQLTSPVAYMTGILSDPFSTQVASVGTGAGAMGYRIASGSWSYKVAAADNQGSKEIFEAMGPIHCYAIIGVGPDGNRCRMGYKSFPFEPNADPAEGPVGELNTAKGKQPNQWMEYDPSNGTSSTGDIYRFGGAYSQGHFMLNDKEIGSPDPIAQAAGAY
jgi:prepilin-type N-terminal cleavage/methylation domain-containing protein